MIFVTHTGLEQAQIPIRDSCLPTLGRRVGFRKRRGTGGARRRGPSGLGVTSPAASSPTADEGSEPSPTPEPTETPEPTATPTPEPSPAPEFTSASQIIEAATAAMRGVDSFHFKMDMKINADIQGMNLDVPMTFEGDYQAPDRFARAMSISLGFISITTEMVSIRTPRTRRPARGRSPGVMRHSSPTRMIS